jgi:hypothetical protein
VSPVRYELGFYIPEDGILHSHRRENLKSYIPVVFSFITTPAKFRGVVTEKYIYTLRTKAETPSETKNGVFWDVTPCGSCKNRRFGGT